MEEVSIEEKKKVILDIMVDVDDFCRKNNIRYTLCAGTLLGAVRHGGFIPWDDDADLFMLREDFDRFIETYKGRKYHLLYDTKTDDEFLKVGYAKVCDTNTTVKTRDSLNKYGIYLDVFPLEPVPEDPEERNRLLDKGLKYTHRLRHRQKKDFISKIISYHHSLDWWWKKCDDLVRDPKYKDCHLVAHIFGNRNKKTLLDKKEFDDLIDIEFEGKRFKSIRNIDRYLTMVYGDYMTPPPLKEREGHRNERFFKK